MSLADGKRHGPTLIRNDKPLGHGATKGVKPLDHGCLCCLYLRAAATIQYPQALDPCGKIARLLGDLSGHRRTAAFVHNRH